MKNNTLDYSSLFRRIALNVILLSIVMVVYLLFSNTTISRHLSFSLYDYFLSIKASDEPVADVVLITIDDDSIKELGKTWPWPRTYHAALINELTKAEAKIVAYDISFTETSVNDTVLTKALKKNKSVIFPLQSEYELNSAYPFVGVVDFGHVEVNIDTDGVLRSVNLYKLSEQESIPGFALSVLRMFEYQQGDLFGGRYVRRNANDKGLVHFVYGQKNSFTSYSFFDVLSGRVPAAELKDKIVFVGMTASGIGDRFRTSSLNSDKFISGIELQAHIFESLRTDNIVHYVPKVYSIILDIVTIILVSIVARRVSPLVAILISVLYVLMLFCITLFLIYFFAYWMPIVSVSVATVSVIFGYGVIGAHLRLKEANRSLNLNVADRTQKLTISNLTLAQEIQERQSIELSLRDSEERLRVLLDGLKIGIVTINDSGEVLTANKTTQDFLKVPLSKLEGNVLDKYFKYDAAHGHQEISSLEIIRQLDHEESSIQVEGELCTVNGQTTPVALHYSKLLVRRSERNYVCLIRDISDQKKSEIITQEFVATVSHELRTPLTSIRGSLGLINSGATGDLSPKTKNLLSVALRNSDRLLMLVNDILDIQRIQLGTLEFNLKPIDIVDIVRQSVEVNEAYAQSYQTKIMYRLPSYPIYVLGDADRLIQVMSNLLSNAAKFSPSEGVVDVIVDMGSQEVRVQVVDYGYGIPEHFRSRIFQKFSQADDAKHRSKGTGLGLSITKALIERMSGHINFHSVEGDGSTFYFTLPVLTPDQLRELLEKQQSQGVVHE